MNSYRHLLVAIDYSPQSQALVKKAQQLAAQYRAKLSLVHVLDNIPMPDTQYGTLIDLNETGDNALLNAERRKLLNFARGVSIETASCFLVWGLPKREITEFAKRQEVDLIAVGSHGRHGLALLLGSTANAVLHHADCDVLSIRIPD